MSEYTKRQAKSEFFDPEWPWAEHWATESTRYPGESVDDTLHRLNQPPVPDWLLGAFIDASSEE